MITRFWPGRPRNEAAALSGFVSIGAPLIAVAELTLLGAILTQELATEMMPWVGQAIAAMCVSVVFMVFCVQYGFWAISYWNGPDEQLAWQPSARASVQQLVLQRVKMAHTQHLFGLIGAIAEWLFRIGVVFFLLGLACLLVPPSTAAPPPATLPKNVGVADWRDVALWIVVAAFLLEALWVSTSLLAGFLDRVLTRLNRAKPPRARPTTAAAAPGKAAVAPEPAAVKAIGVLRDLLWFISKPFFPTRWNGPYIPLDRPDSHTVQALLDRIGELPQEAAAELARQPREWGDDRVEWRDDRSVILPTGLLLGRVWTDWPWGVFTIDRDITVIHPFGATQGDASEVRERMHAIRGYLSKRRHRGRLNHDRLDAVVLHLDHLVDDAPKMMTCRICAHAAVRAP